MFCHFYLHVLPLICVSATQNHNKPWLVATGRCVAWLKNKKSFFSFPPHPETFPSENENNACIFHFLKCSTVFNLSPIPSHTLKIAPLSDTCLYFVTQIVFSLLWLHNFHTWMRLQLCCIEVRLRFSSYWYNRFLVVQLTLLAFFILNTSTISPACDSSNSRLLTCPFFIYTAAGSMCSSVSSTRICGGTAGVKIKASKIKLKSAVPSSVAISGHHCDQLVHKHNCSQAPTIHLCDCIRPVLPSSPVKSSSN